jgi:hypothetical protein
MNDDPHKLEDAKRQKPSHPWWRHRPATRAELMTGAGYLIATILAVLLLCLAFNTLLPPALNVFTANPRTLRKAQALNYYNKLLLHLPPGTSVYREKKNRQIGAYFPRQGKHFSVYSNIALYDFQKWPEIEFNGMAGRLQQASGVSTPMVAVVLPREQVAFRFVGYSAQEAEAFLQKAVFPAEQE